jgi:hypothetical protein
MRSNRPQIIIRAKQLIQSEPSLGKSKINEILKKEFGSGLRSQEVLNIKNAVARENPKLISQLYYKGGAPKSSMGIYNGWRNAGFLPHEARELTLGHSHEFDSGSVFNSEPSKKARQSRIEWINLLKKQGWTDAQIRREILDYYVKGREKSPWDFIRAEYRDKKKIDFIDYKKKAQIRAKRKTNRLYR